MAFKVLRRVLALLVAIVAVAASTGMLLAQTVSVDPLKGGALGNDRIVARWTLHDGHLSGVVVREKSGGALLSLDGPFAIALRDGSVLQARDLVMSGEPRVEHFTPDPTAAQYSERLPGIAVHYALIDPEGRFTADWAVILRQRSQYIRQSLTIHAGAQPADVSDILLVDFRSPGVALAGVVKGSPLIDGRFLSWL